LGGVSANDAATLLLLPLLGFGVLMLLLLLLIVVPAAAAASRA
jgi:hypothetical protein